MIIIIFILGISFLVVNSICCLNNIWHNTKNLFDITPNINKVNWLNKANRVMLLPQDRLRTQFPSYLAQYNLGKRYYSTKPVLLNPYFVTGFSDAEGCFMIRIHSNKTYTLGWTTNASFEIGLHLKDIALLEAIKTFFGVGKITISENRDVASYRVNSIKQLVENILPHFDKYPLISKKSADYLLFKAAVLKIYNKEHLNQKGLEEIVAIKASLNLGLSSLLKQHFPHIFPITKPEVSTQSIPNSNWLTGFTEGDGCFYIRKQLAPKSSLGVRFGLTFELSQDSRDMELFVLIQKYLNCGKVTLKRSDTVCVLTVNKIEDIQSKVIPLFLPSGPQDKNSFYGIKRLNFLGWCEAANLIACNKHLTKDGIMQLNQIKEGLNLGRRWERDDE